jgi:hypothetical protein
MIEYENTKDLQNQFFLRNFAKIIIEMEEKIKLLPSGISDFKQLRRQNRYYVDKSMYIPTIETVANFQFLIRPRRFGKSLFLTMLSAYYDLNERDNFQDLFKGLWIADHPTELQGQYQVLYMDFSRVSSQLDRLEENFYDYMSVILDSFAQKYEHCYCDGFAETVSRMKTASMKLDYINNTAKENNMRLYLIVDEYDNFTNNVLNEHGERVYWSLTHATGFYRDVFKKFKGMFERILMMGVSLVTLDDLTSGYNIATNITTFPEFNQMLGLSEVDVREMIRYYQSVGKIAADAEERLVAEMKPWYNNYCFAKDSLTTDPKMFNCNMVVYYLSNYIRSGKAPEQMIDPNTKTDYTKMKKVIQLDKLDGNRRSILHQIAQDGFIYGEVEESFPAEHLYDPKMFVSLLFYYGMLTMGGTYRGKLKLIIPNNNVRKQYYQYLLEEYNRIHPADYSLLDDAFSDAAYDGNWRPMLEQMAQAYKENTSVRSLIEGERNIQGFMNAYLTLCRYYLTAPEVELNHGYCDFFLMPDLDRYPDIEHCYILELKYLKTDAKAEEAENQWQQAVEQIRGYGQGERVRLLKRHTQLHLIVMQMRGYNIERLEEII